MDSGQLDQLPHRNKNRLQWKSLLHANRYHSTMANLSEMAVVERYIFGCNGSLQGKKSSSRGTLVEQLHNGAAFAFKAGGTSTCLES